MSRLARRLRAAEQPVLERAGLSMWEYVALALLAREPAQSQQELARVMGYDKTRLIRLLDDLQARDLVTRAPSHPDRRAHVVRITPAGRRAYDAARRAVRAMEEELLGPLEPAERRTLRKSLARLVTTPPHGV